MMQESTIKDLNVISGNIDNLAYYCNDEMLDENVFIKVITFESELEIYETWIEVYHRNETDSMKFDMYIGSILAPIQERRIIKDIYELYRDHSLMEFIDILHELNEGFKSASMQINDEHKLQVQENVEMEFKRLLYMADLWF